MVREDIQGLQHPQVPRFRLAAERRDRRGRRRFFGIALVVWRRKSPIRIRRRPILARRIAITGTRRRLVPARLSTRLRWLRRKAVADERCLRRFSRRFGRFWRGTVAHVGAPDICPMFHRNGRGLAAGPAQDRQHTERKPPRPCSANAAAILYFLVQCSMLSDFFATPPLGDKTRTSKSPLPWTSHRT